MMNEKKSYKVQIFEDPYILSSDESEALVMKAAEMVDASMKEISHQCGLVDAKKIAVLTALRFAGKVLAVETEQGMEHEKQIALKKYIDQELSLL